MNSKYIKGNSILERPSKFELFPPSLNFKRISKGSSYHTAQIEDQVIFKVFIWYTWRYSSNLLTKV